jgi:translation initiation factor 2 subunit 3
LKFRSEKISGKTLTLGYANAKIYKCPRCPEPDCYQSYPCNTFNPHLKFLASTKSDANCKNQDCNQKLILVRHISFVDCPGHEALMEVVLTGASVMDAALLLVASNAPCP